MVADHYGFYAQDLPTIRLMILDRLDTVRALQEEADEHQRQLKQLKGELNRMLDLATRTIENH